MIFIITTDGYENSSKEYSYDKIKQMIEHQKSKYGWEFMFLGANMDAVTEARKFGIQPERAVTFHNDSEGVQLNYQVVGQAISCLREMNCMDEMGDSWKEDIEKVYKKRKKSHK